MIDLRSDTVTRPTPAMRRAMAEAEVGDDVFGEDPTVNALQDEVAALLGFEAALWVPTGTMGNAVALRVLGEAGQEVLVDERSHVVRYELAGLAVLSGLMPRTVRTPDGLLTVEHVHAALSPHAYYKSDLGLVVLENTHNLAGGVVHEAAAMRAVIDAAHEAGLRVHVDGARLWNAAVALGVAPRELVAGADTVMVALSKGLCAPAGSLVVSSRENIARARRVRKQLGGGMRQVGILAAAGLEAIRTMIPRLADDHAHARLLADALASCGGVRVPPARTTSEREGGEGAQVTSRELRTTSEREGGEGAQVTSRELRTTSEREGGEGAQVTSRELRTNIVIGALDGRTAADVVAAMQQRGVLISAMDATTIRMVTHHDVSRADCEEAAAALRAVLG